MNLIKTLTAASAVAIMANGVIADEIRVLNWQGYGTDQEFALGPFTEATGHTVVHDYFNSEQEMLTKLRTNPGAYDVVLNSSISEVISATYCSASRVASTAGPFI